MKRPVYDIKKELEICSTEHYTSKVLSTIGLICTIILSTLFYLFVLNKGNVFDIVLSCGVVLFFVILILYNLYRYNDLSKSKKSLEREYMIATETPEQKLQRTRSEKLTRVLKEEE